jgi:hypothetical protein
MREMRAGQWVAFDASTEIPHKCGKKNKEDIAIKNLGKQKNKKEDNDSVDLGYETKIDNEIKVLEKRLKDIEEKDNFNHSKEKLSDKKNTKFESNANLESKNINTYVYPKKKGFMFYFWTFVIILNLFALSRCISD